MEGNTWYAPLSQLWGEPKFGSSTICQTIEIFQCEGESEPRIIEGEVNGSTLATWLDKDLSMLSDLKTPVSGLRILIGDHSSTSDDISITKESSLLIEQKFDLHENFWTYLRTNHCYASQYCTSQTSTRSKPGLHRLLFKSPKKSTTHFQLSLAYLGLSQLTTVFLIIGDTFPKPERVLALLRSQAKFHFYPLLLPILLAEAFVENKSIWTHMFTVNIENIGAATGQHDLLDQKSGDIIEINFEKTTTSLNVIGNALEGYFQSVRAMRAALVKLQTWGDIIYSSPSTEPRNHQLQNQDRELVLDKLKYLRDTCDDLILQLESNKSRIQLLLQVVYQFMAQKDARVNISLAETSTAIAKASKADSEVMKVIAIQTKRDSSAMKTIAVLGMFFLPGTFIAAILSMPVFDLSDAPGGVIKDGFKIYWALTASLTVVVFLCWIAAVTVPWRKILEKMGWKGRLLGPNVEVVDLELDAENEDKSDSKDKDRKIENQDREKNNGGVMEVSV